MLIENLPERGSLPQLLRRASTQRDDPLANMNCVLGTFNARGGKIELHRLWIAVNKIKDAVPAGIHTRDQVRPGHWTLRWNAGCELTERSLLHQFGKIRHLPFADKSRKKLWI